MGAINEWEILEQEYRVCRATKTGVRKRKFYRVVCPICKEESWKRSDWLVRFAACGWCNDNAKKAVLKRKANQRARAATQAQPEAATAGDQQEVVREGLPAASMQDHEVSWWEDLDTYSPSSI